MTSSLRAETDALLTVIQNRVAVATGRAPDTGDRKSRTINRSRVGRLKRGARGRVTGKRRVRRRTGSRRARARRTEPNRTGRDPVCGGRVAAPAISQTSDVGSCGRVTVRCLTRSSRVAAAAAAAVDRLVFGASTSAGFPGRCGRRADEFSGMNRRC